MIQHGNLLTADETYICHQCNCLTTRSAFLAYKIFQAFPFADVYKDRTIPSTPGSIAIRGNGIDQRFVIGMFAQYYPGKTKYPNSSKDGLEARINYFKACLEQMKHLEGSFAFPYRIGCNAAGGSWDIYYDMLENFSKSVKGKVVIYRLDPPPQTSLQKPSLFDDL